MDKDEIRTDRLYMWLMAVMILGMAAIFAIYVRTLTDKIDALEKRQEEQDTMHKTELDCTNLYIEAVKNELTASIDDQQKQIDSQSEQISRIKNVQSNTNKAFTRFQKQQEQVEADLREELKKD